MYQYPTFESNYFPERLPPNNVSTREEKKRAKRDYKEYQKANPAGFKNSQNQFKLNFVDKLSKVKRLRFNLKKVHGIS